jgi:hypothetical protein
LSPDVFAVVENAPLGKALGHRRMFLNLEQAVTAWRALQEEQAVEEASGGVQR